MEQNWSGKGLEKFCKINSVVTMLNDLKNFCCLHLKCSVMFCFASNFYRIYLHLYAALFMAYPGMNAIGKMHEVRFPNISILSHIFGYILPLTIIISLAIKAVGFSKVRQTLSIIFAMH